MSGPESASDAIEVDGAFRVVPLRATGVIPEVVAENLERELNEQASGGFELDRVEPIIYNSSTTGYLLLTFRRAAQDAP